VQSVPAGEVVFLHVLGLHILQVLRSQPLLNRINGSKTLSDDVKYKAGNYWMLNPNISFAANDRISLTGGIQWLGKQPDRLGGKKESARNSGCCFSK